MGSALVLASVTAVLKNLLENGLIARGVTAGLGSNAVLSALPPDRIPTGAEERAQLNLFLYQIAQKGLAPSSRYALDANAAARPHPRRFLELQYLLTAYGAQDLHTEILFGYAIELLNEHPHLTGEAVGKILASLSARDGSQSALPAYAALASPEIVEQIEQISICPQAANPEEMLNLWSTFQTAYRPSLTYKVTVELREALPAPV